MTSHSCKLQQMERAQVRERGRGLWANRISSHRACQEYRRILPCFVYLSIVVSLHVCRLPVFLRLVHFFASAPVHQNVPKRGGWAPRSRTTAHSTCRAHYSVNVSWSMRSHPWSEKSCFRLEFTCQGLRVVQGPLYWKFWITCLNCISSFLGKSPSAA